MLYRFIEENFVCGTGNWTQDLHAELHWALFNFLFWGSVSLHSCIIHPLAASWIPHKCNHKVSPLVSQLMCFVMCFVILKYDLHLAKFSLLHLRDFMRLPKTIITVKTKNISITLVSSLMPMWPAPPPSSPGHIRLLTLQEFPPFLSVMEIESYPHSVQHLGGSLSLRSHIRDSPVPLEC